MNELWYRIILVCESINKLYRNVIYNSTYNASLFMEYN